MDRKALSFNSVLLLFLIGLVIGITLMFSQAKTGRINEKTTDFSYRDIRGRAGHLYGVDGPVILHFWASWCAPCREELPQLITKSAAMPGTAFLLISADREAAVMSSALAPYSLAKNVTVIHDPQMTITFDHFKVDRFPETLILNENKIITRHLYGAADWENIK